MTEDPGLGFSYNPRKNGEVEVLRHGRLASTLRGNDAADVLQEIEGGDERPASHHPRSSLAESINHGKNLPL